MTKHYITNKQGQHLTDAYGNKLTAYFTVTENEPTRAQKLQNHTGLLSVVINRLMSGCSPRWAMIFKQN